MNVNEYQITYLKKLALNSQQDNRILLFGKQFF